MYNQLIYTDIGSLVNPTNVREYMVADNATSVYFPGHSGYTIAAVFARNDIIGLYRAETLDEIRFVMREIAIELTRSRGDANFRPVVDMIDLRERWQAHYEISKAKKAAANKAIKDAAKSKGGIE